MFEKRLAGLIVRAVKSAAIDEGWSQEVLKPVLERGIRLEWPKK